MMGNILPRAFFLDEYKKMKWNQNGYVFESTGRSNEFNFAV